MRAFHNKHKITGIAVGVILLLSVGAFVWCSQRRPTLIDLQREMLEAQGDSLKQQKVLEKLDEYYLTMPIPENIRREVEARVDSLKYDSADFTPEKLDSAPANLDTSIYMIEYRIRDVLRNAMIARSREDMPTFQTIIAYAENLAGVVKAKLGDDYWPPRLEEVKSFDADQARDWLLADQASLLCIENYTGEFEKGEKFAAFSLQCLQQVKDERIQLDLTQGFFVILFQSRGLYELAYPLAEKGIQKADEIKYRKRVVGLNFNYALALHTAGRNHQALKEFSRTINSIKIISELPGMDWYETNTRLGIATTYLQLGNYDKTLLICDEVEKLPLDNLFKLALHTTRGITYINLGRYDIAEAEYYKALNLTIANNDTVNQIIVISNLARLHFRLTEYDKASVYYQEAMSLLLKYYPKNFEYRSRTLIRLAEVEAARDDKERFNAIIQETEKLIKLINNPTVKGEYLILIGQLNLDLKNFQQAYDYFRQAVMLYETSGLFREALETKTKQIRSLIGLSNYQEAKKLLDILYVSARKLHDTPTQIDAVGLSSYIAYREGNIEQAIQESNRLISKTEELSNQFTNLDNLITFRQKIYPYLNNAVIYELTAGRIDSAFVKLDYSKARESKHRLTQNNGKFDFSSQAFINIDSLKTQFTERQMLIDYLVTEDTLYAFVLFQNGLHLFKQAIHIDELRHLANDYIEVINNSRKYLDPYQPAVFQANYDSVLSLGRGLYKILFDWPELRTRLQHTEITYIIPDDILYGIPFSCLNESDDSQPQFLIQKTAIVNLPSAVFLQSFPSEILTENFYKKGVLICADRNEFPKVEELVKYIKYKFPQAEELIIDKSDIRNDDVILKLNEGYDIYFLIGHSIPNLKFPDLSNIQLTPLRKSDKMPFRVELSLSDLKRIDWSHTEMVFLIGCETAIGKLYEGSGFSGFQQNLLTRGAKAVMASSWEIDNMMAFRQVKKFLDTWDGTNDSAKTLQNVEMEWIQWLQKDSFYKEPHPILWKTMTLSQTTK